MIMSALTFLLGLVIGLWRYFLAVILGALSVMGLGLLEQTVLAQYPADIQVLLPKWLPTTLFNGAIMGILALPVGLLLIVLMKITRTRSSFIYLAAGAIAGYFSVMILAMINDQPFDPFDFENLQMIVCMIGGAFAGLYYRLLAI